MNELQVFVHNNVEVVDSRVVAEMIGRQHKHLLRDIAGYCEIMKNGGETKIGPSDFFIEHSYITSQNKRLPCYLLTKKGCDMVANKMTGEKGVLFTAAYVTAFEKMKQELTVPRLPADFPAALRMLADAEEKRMALEAENEYQKQVIADFEPMKRYIDVILASPGTMTTTQIAADYNLSAKKLNRILSQHGIQRNVNGQWILYVNHMGNGYTKSETISIIRSDGRPDTILQTRWTQKGRLMINDVLNSLGIYAIMDMNTTE